MKALVITNCATAAYTSGLRILFPEWEVKGANLDVAQEWLGTEPNESFCTFLDHAELLVLGSENECEFEEHSRDKDVLSIPYFHFQGLHPDCFHLGVGDAAVPSVLKAGNLHSRIVVAAFVLGLSERDCAAAFSAHTYERLGYFSQYETEKTNLLERFTTKEIDLASAFACWQQAGSFLYTYNHPKAYVFNDIIVEALSGRYLGAPGREKAREALTEIPDYLDPSIRWPIYPEIAARYGLQSEFLWRTGINAGPIVMSLPDFIARSYETLARFPALTGDCVPGFAECRYALTR